MLENVLLWRWVFKVSYIGLTLASMIKILVQVAFGLRCRTLSSSHAKPAWTLQYFPIDNGLKL